MRVTALISDEEERRRREVEELRRRQRLYVGERSSWKRLDLASLRVGRFVEDTRTGERYRVYRGEVLGVVNLPISAWYVGPDEWPVFLQAVR